MKLQTSQWYGLKILLARLNKLKRFVAKITQRGLEKFENSTMFLPSTTHIVIKRI